MPRGGPARLSEKDEMLKRRSLRQRKDLQALIKRRVNNESQIPGGGAIKVSIVNNPSRLEQKLGSK